MTIYQEIAAMRLTSGFTDADGDSITLRRINGSVVTSFPQVVTVSGKTFRVWGDGVVVYDDLGDTSGHPADGAEGGPYTFTYTVWDGREESPTYTASITLTGVAVSAPGTGEIAGFVAKWVPAGYNEGTGVWTDTVSSRTLTATGSPTLTTAPSGVPAVRTSSGAYFTGTDLTGLPTGASPVTIYFCGRDRVTSASAWGGFAIGGTTVNSAFSLLIHGVDDTIGLDMGGGVAYGGTYVGNEAPFVAVAAHDGTNAYASYFKTPFQEVIDGNPITLNIDPAGNIRLGRNAAGTSARDLDIYAVYIYDEAHSQAQREQMSDYLNETYLNDVVPPSVTAVTLTQIDATSLGMSITTNEHGRVWGVVTTSATQPSDEQIEAGQNHSGAAAAYVLDRTVQIPQSVTGTATGLTASTTYHLHAFAEDAAGNRSGVVSSAGQATTATDTLATTVSPDSISVSTTVAVGSTIAQLVANQPGTFSKVSGPAWITIQSDGQVKASSAATAGTANLVARHTNTAGTFDKTISTTATAPSTGGVTYDYETTWPGLVTLLNSWAGTVPGGGTKRIKVTGAHTGATSLADVRLTNGVAEIHASGPFTDTINANGSYNIHCGADKSGSLRLERAKGLKFFRCAFFGTEMVQIWGDCDITFEECYFEAAPYNPTIAGNQETTQTICVYLGENSQGAPKVVSGVHFLRCAFQYSRSAFLKFKPATNCSIVECVGAWKRHDDYKLDVSCDGFQIINTWGCRDNNRDTVTGGGVHVDFFQIYKQDGLAGEFKNIYGRGCVDIFARDANPAHYSRQMFFGDSSSPINGGLFEDNLCCIQHGALTYFVNKTGPVETRNCDGIRIRELNEVGYAPRAYSTPTSNNYGIGRSANSGWVGTNGLFRAWTTLEANNAHTTDYTQYVPSGDFTSVPDDNDWSMEPFMPSITSRRHWDNPNPVGWYRRAKEIFVDKNVPRNWPRRRIWKQQYDRTNYLINALGSLDAYGNEA